MARELTARSLLQRLRALRGGALLLTVVAGLGLALVAGRVLSFLWIESLWHGGVGYSDVFWRRLGWTWGLRLAVGLAVGGLLFLNLRLVARTLGGIQIKRRFGNLEISEQLPPTYVAGAIGGISLLVALWFGGSIPESLGLQALLASVAPAWGARDPVFAMDLSFYVFVLPLLRVSATFVLIVLFLVFTVCLAGYAATGAVRWGSRGLVMGELPRVHMGALAAAFLAILGARFWLGRYVLLLYGGSDVQGIFGFTDYHARIPALQIMTALTLLAAAAVLWGAWKNRMIPVVAGVAVVVAGGLLAVQFYPSLVQRFRVQPNELGRETPWIEQNIAFTRLGFGLDRMQRVGFRYVRPDGVDWSAARAQFEGLPVWTANALLTTFREVEARFPYYDFSNVAIDRYPRADGSLQTVALAVREVEPSGIQDPNWQNLYLRERYLTGMGAVASDAADRTAEGRPPMFLTGIPPEFTDRPDAPESLRLRRPAVYFSSRPQGYAILNPADDALMESEPVPGLADVDGPAGIALSSPWRTAALAWYLREPNLLFASEVDASSRVVLRRQIRERVAEIAPFFRFPESPYPVIHEGRLLWMLEGFTATRSFPLSSPHELEFRRGAVSWVRNSVKVVVDAISGEVTFYRLPGEDPLLEAYARAFPDLLGPLDAMPAELRAHLRYPRSLVDLQADVLLQYHQDTAPAFHGQQDVWSVPTELAQGTGAVPYRPEYGIYRLPGESEPSFLLTTVFVPAGRQNLTAILTARLGEDGHHELILHDVAVEDQAPGPRQIEALVEQDTKISEQFSLWRQGGSQVWSGHLHLVPVDDHLLYMEPVFLAADTDAIPELRRFVVSDGRRVAMEETLAQTIAVLAGESPPAVPTVAGAGADAPGAPAADRWSAEALELLRRAETRLRDGDFQGFGTALQELRDLLERLSRPAAPGG